MRCVDCAVMRVCFRRFRLRQVIWAVTGICFFLSLWIVLPGPNLFFLRLAVGAPEISPLLGLVSAIALFFALVKLTRRGFTTYRKPPKALIGLLLVTLLLCSLPLLQQPRAVAAANRSMAIAFGPNQQPASVKAFSWLTLFQGFPEQAVRQRQNIPYETPAGVPLKLDLYQPLQPGRYPAVVAVYGGSWMRGAPAESEAMGRFLAARGYVVAALDYRHAPEYRFPAQLEDVAAGLAFVREQAEDFEIERDRIALLGWSAGAHLAMLAGFQAAEPVKSIVDFYGPVDLFNGYYDIPQPDPVDVRQVLRAFIGGAPEEFPEAYKAASPLTYVEAAEPNSLPTTLLIYGGRDHLVEARFGRSLYEALIEGDNRAVWVKIPWAEHAFDKIFNGVSNQMALHFVERFLAQTLN